MRPRAVAVADGIRVGSVAVPDADGDSGAERPRDPLADSDAYSDADGSARDTSRRAADRHRSRR